MDLSSVLDLRLSDDDDQGPSKRAKIEPGDLDDFAYPSCIFKNGPSDLIDPRFSQLWNNAMQLAIEESPYSSEEKWLEIARPPAYITVDGFWFYPLCINCGIKLPVRKQRFQDMFCRQMCLELLEIYAMYKYFG